MSPDNYWLPKNYYGNRLPDGKNFPIKNPEELAAKPEKKKDQFRGFEDDFFGKRTYEDPIINGDREEIFKNSGKPSTRKQHELYWRLKYYCNPVAMPYIIQNFSSLGKFSEDEFKNMIKDYWSKITQSDFPEELFREVYDHNPNVQEELFKPRLFDRTAKQILWGTMREILRTMVYRIFGS